MDRIEAFEQMMGKIDYFIKNPTDFLYENIEDPTYQEIIECTRAIAVSNSIILAEKTKSMEDLARCITDSKAIVATGTTRAIKSSSQKEIGREYKDLSEIIEYITYSGLDDETEKKLSHFSREDLLRLKLYFYKQYIEIKKTIRKSILENPLEDIKEYQHKLGLYELTIEFLKDVLNKTSSEIIIEEEEEKEFSRFVFVPNGKKSTYIFEDIEELSEQSKIIKTFLEKVPTGYFLQTKDTKSIEGYRENLCEYTHKNGLRLLYVVDGSIIHICSLFMKDKQRSTRISNEYDEAISRYYSSKSYVDSNFQNPYFHIEQAELQAEIFTFLENNIALSKKDGE